jgi:hypothetical protein
MLPNATAGGWCLQGIRMLGVAASSAVACGGTEIARALTYVAPWPVGQVRKPAPRPARRHVTFAPEGRQLRTELTFLLLLHHHPALPSLCSHRIVTGTVHTSLALIGIVPSLANSDATMWNVRLPPSILATPPNLRSS